MKTINAGKLVRVNPDVISPGRRAKPGYQNVGENPEVPWEISCAGATVEFNLQYGANEIATVPAKFYVDGNLIFSYAAGDYQYTFESLTQLGGAVAQAFSSVGVSVLAHGLSTQRNFWRLVNDTMSDKRIRITLETNDYLIAHYKQDYEPVVNNPTWMLEGNDLVVCLRAKQERFFISCDDAKSQIHFDYLAGFWDVFLDGILIVDNKDTNAIYAIIRDNYTDKINIESDGFWDFWNTDTISHQILLVPRGYNAYLYNPSENSTPAYFENDDGSIGFCLSANH